MRNIQDTDESHGKHGHEGDEMQHKAPDHMFHGEGHDSREHFGHKGGDFRSEFHGHAPSHLWSEHFGGRARRGEVRYVLMDALSSGPKHGYEIVKVLEERSQGQYVPSPGVVYPTLQFLLDKEMVSASQEGDRRVYQLTNAGETELKAHAAEVEGFWARFEAKGIAQTSRHEVTFLEEELDSLNRTIWSGLDEAIERGEQEKIQRVRQAVVRCRDDIRTIIAGAA